MSYFKIDFLSCWCLECGKGWHNLPLNIKYQIIDYVEEIKLRDLLKQKILEICSEFEDDSPLFEFVSNGLEDALRLFIFPKRDALVKIWKNKRMSSFCVTSKLDNNLGRIFRVFIPIVNSSEFFPTI